MTMTRKDYVKFAAMLKQHNTIYGEVRSNPRTSPAQAVTHAMADLLADDNPNFDRARFLAACGVES